MNIAFFLERPSTTVLDSGSFYLNFHDTPRFLEALPSARDSTLWCDIAWCRSFLGSLPASFPITKLLVPQALCNHVGFSSHRAMNGISNIHPSTGLIATKAAAGAHYIKGYHAFTPFEGNSKINKRTKPLDDTCSPPQRVLCIGQLWCLRLRRCLR